MVEGEDVECNLQLARWVVAPTSLAHGGAIERRQRLPSDDCLTLIVDGKNLNRESRERSRKGDEEFQREAN